jgi:hypothetical protein
MSDGQGAGTPSLHHGLDQMKKKPPPPAARRRSLLSRLRTFTLCAAILVAAALARQGLIDRVPDALPLTYVLQLISALTVGSILAIALPKPLLDQVFPASTRVLRQSTIVTGVLALAGLATLPASHVASLAIPAAHPWAASMPKIVNTLLTTLTAIYGTIVTFLAVVHLRSTTPRSRHE